MSIVPTTFAIACEFVRRHHRHNKKPQGMVFTLGASDGAQLVGVAIVGRPVPPGLQDGWTLEVLRNCVVDDAPKGTPSALYGAAWRAARALGWRRLMTYTLQSESGASLRGAGWTILAERDARDPAGWQNRRGREFQEVVGQAKFLWSAADGR